ncbi:hypothetical protein [Xenorhabdus bharatensis]|uniref:hypothetical protein n=1 Tax=Xenorhabdus bharatensis TaxID=3136256 RepID=UPI0030F3F4BE
MITIDQANKINHDVREHFRYGYKSGNKVYSLVYGSKSYERKNYRNDHALDADTCIEMQRTDSFTVHDMIAMPPEERAGNCQEYTDLAVYFATNIDLVSTIWVFGCDEYPEDESTDGVSHTFCVFNLSVIPNNLPRLNNMSSANFPSDAIVCDPWANIVCLCADYPRKLRNKVFKWYVSGKNIHLRMQPISAIEWGA